MFRNIIRISSSHLAKHSNKNFTIKNVSTVDIDEIQKFDSFSSFKHNWYTSKIMKPLRSMNELRVPLIRDQLLARKLITDVTNEKYDKEDQKKATKQTDQPLKGFRILDVGCGGGLLSQPLARLGADVTGLDANENNIQLASKYTKEFAPELLNRLHFQTGTLEEVADSDSKHQTHLKQFDAVLASELLEHINNVELFIQNVKKILRLNGQFFITTINQSIFAYLGAIVLGENVLNLVPKGTHSYDKLVLLNGLELLLRDNGFSVNLIQGMCFNPLTHRWYWTPNTSINYALVATKTQ